MFWNKKIFIAIASFIAIILVIASINIGVFFSIRTNTNNDYNQVSVIPSNLPKIVKEKLERVKKIAKNNTISLNFIGNDGSKSSGTAWLKNIDTKNTETQNDDEYIFATNLHVLSNFLEYNSITNQISLNLNNISNVNVKYFASYENKNLYLSRTSPDQWRVTNDFIKFRTDENATVPSVTESLSFGLMRDIGTTLPEKNLNNDVINQNNRYYVTNGYVDYIELRFKPNESNDSFLTWLTAKLKCCNLPINYLSSISNETYDTNNQQSQKASNLYFYFAGFPNINAELKYREQLILPSSNNDILNHQIVSPPNFVGLSSWLSNNYRISITDIALNKKLGMRNIANQLILKNAALGQGGSGSMVFMFDDTSTNPNVYLVGIWWGQYGNSWGGVDLLETKNKYLAINGYQDKIYWPGYTIRDK